MFGGFAVMTAGLLLRGESALAVLRNMVSFPAVLFLAGGLIGLVFMIIFSVRMKGNSARENRIEQFTNIFAQGMFLICLLSAMQHPLP